MVPALLEGNRLEGKSSRWSAPAGSTRKPATRPPRDRPEEGKRGAGGEEPAAGAADHGDIETKLRLLKRLFDEKLITEEEYTAKKAQLLRSF